ncbi:protein-tyrosine phosphatase family protein [Microbacterium sp. PMB16]|uniref:protein-tyrosine phosphatase family protein n=1 Tax=Microbacterium sp. PMB16 TaxID=3120157 RepID=UPI003F4B77E5
MTWTTDLPGVVALPGGRLVRGRALRNGPVADGPAPTLGLYLTTKPHHEAGWESHWVRWPDFRLPTAPTDAIAALRMIHERSADERVEIACGGGRGRTGTAIALLARFAGVPASDAVAWTRAHYRAGAVETPWQRRFVRDVDLEA